MLHAGVPRAFPPLLDTGAHTLRLRVRARLGALFHKLVRRVRNMDERRILQDLIRLACGDDGLSGRKILIELERADVLAQWAACEQIEAHVEMCKVLRQLLVRLDTEKMAVRQRLECGHIRPRLFSADPDKAPFRVRLGRMLDEAVLDAGLKRADKAEYRVWQRRQLRRNRLRLRRLIKALEIRSVRNKAGLWVCSAEALRQRSRRPPLDAFNALLSFAYNLLAHDCASALESVGLDAYVGFLHRDRPGRESLALDLMEELRPCLADRFVLTLVNNRVMRAADFDFRESGAVLLTKEGRRTFLQHWQARKRETLTHPFLEEKLPWGLVPYVQSLLLARYLRGDLDAYPPFLWK